MYAMMKTREIIMSSHTIFLDSVVLILVALYVYGFLSTYPESLWIREGTLPRVDTLSELLDVILWSIVALSCLDLIIKYRNSPTREYFFRKNITDIILLVLVPFVATLKAAKIAVHASKSLKVTSKMYKLYYKAKKIFAPK